MLVCSVSFIPRAERAKLLLPAWAREWVERGWSSSVQWISVVSALAFDSLAETLCSG